MKNTILQILTDSIILQRMCEAAEAAATAFNPNELLYSDPMDQVNGHYIAFSVLGLEGNEELTNQLSKLYFDNINKKQNAKDLACVIYSQWENIIPINPTPIRLQLNNTLKIAM